MNKISQSDANCFEKDARCLNNALLHGNLQQAFSIIVDLMIASGQKLTAEQAAECYQRGLFEPLSLSDFEGGNGGQSSV